MGVKIKVLRSLGKGWPDLAENETSEVDGDIAKALIKNGLAVRVDDPAPVIQAVPPQPTIAEAATVPKATDDLKSFRGRVSRKADNKPKSTHKKES